MIRKAMFFVIWGMCSVALAHATGKASFSAILLDPSMNAPLISALGEACASSVQGIYKSGHTFELDVIKKKLKLLSQAPTESEGSHFDFFHYTPSNEVVIALHPELVNRQEAQKLIRNEGGYESFLHFIRTRRKPIYTMGLSVSSAWESAKVHGPRLVSFTFSPNTRVFDQNDLNYMELIAELNQRFPGLTVKCDPGNLYYFALDDSGADLVDFHGDPSGGHKWFQVISFKSVIESHVLN